MLKANICLVNIMTVACFYLALELVYLEPICDFLTEFLMYINERHFRFCVFLPKVVSRWCSALKRKNEVFKIHVIYCFIFKVYFLHVFLATNTLFALYSWQQHNNWQKSCNFRSKFCRRDTQFLKKIVKLTFNVKKMSKYWASLKADYNS